MLYSSTEDGRLRCGYILSELIAHKEEIDRIARADQEDESQEVNNDQDMYL